MSLDVSAQTVLHPAAIPKYYSFIQINSHIFYVLLSGLGYAVAQLVEALRYKPESCGFDS
jgi:hypothetical protein